MKSSQKNNSLNEKKEKKAESRHVILTVYFRDLKRIFLNPIAAFIIIALFFLPGLYAWCGIGANWDPYANVKNMPVAVVNEDQAAESSIAGTLEIGKKIEDKLKDNQSVKWNFMNREDAMQAIEIDLVYAVIIIPDHFSSDIAKIFQGEDVRDFAKFELYVNERKSQVGIKVGDGVGSTVESTINSTFRGTVSNVVATKATELTKKGVTDVSQAASTVSSRLKMISDTINSLDTTMQISENGVSNLQNTIDNTRITLNELKTQFPYINSSLTKIDNTLNIFIADLGPTIQELKDAGFEKLPEVFENIVNSMNTIKNSIADIKSVINDVEGTLDRALVAINDADTMIQNLKTTGSNLRIGLSSSAQSLEEISKKISNFNETSNNSTMSNLLNMDAEAIGTFMSSAVKLDTETMYKIDHYGTSVAPFYSCITFWIGGICLLALLNIEVQKPRKRRITAKEEYISRGLLFATLAACIGLICGIGDLLIGIQCCNIALFLSTCIFSCVVFVMIIYTLAACFKHIGKAAAIVLVVLQIPGSSGMYPVEILPQAFQIIHPFLPFTYAINALRETIVAIKIDMWFLNIGVLAFMLFITILAGLYLRNALASVNNLFDSELQQNGIIECEKKENASHHGSSATETVVELMAKSNEYQEEIDMKATNFLKSYKTRRRNALICMAVVPQIFIISLCVWFAFCEVDINTKVILMFVWLLLLVIFAIYIVSLEYIRTKLSVAYTHDKDDIIALEGADAIEAQLESSGANV